MATSHDKPDLPLPHGDDTAHTGVPQEGGSEGGCPEELLSALEMEAEGPWTEQRLTDGALAESLSVEVRGAALAAFDESISEHADLESDLESALEDLLPEALLSQPEELELLSKTPLGPSVRAAALAAFDASLEDLDDLEEAEDEAAAPAPVLQFPVRAVPMRDASGALAVSERPLRARRLRSPWFLRPAAAAALLLVVLGAGLFLFSGDEEAEAGLQLRALSRRDLSSHVGMSQVQPAYFATMGSRFAPSADEYLAFGLWQDAVVVVGAGDSLRVAPAATSNAGLSKAALKDAGLGRDAALLRLESGEARLATREHAIALQLDGIGVLVLERGAAHVALTSEAVGQGGASVPAVALVEHSVARFYRADGTSVPLAGPTRVQLAAAGPKAFGTPAQSLFRELRFFGGPLPTATQVRTVSPRLFEIAGGRARRGAQDVRILEADDVSKPSHVSLSWRPPAVLADARVIRVSLRAPVGTKVALSQAEGRSPVAEVTRGGSATEPGVATVELKLERDWYQRLKDGRLELTIEVPAAASKATGEAVADSGSSSGAAPMKKGARRDKPVRAWFDGIALVLGPSRDGLPVAKSSRDAKDVRSKNSDG